MLIEIHSPIVLSKLRPFFHIETTEIIVFIYLIAYCISFISTENLLLEKACKINANLSQSSCDAMVTRNRSAYKEEEELVVQTLVSKIQIYVTFIEGLFPFFMMAFLGSWSDRNGRRKPLMVVPLCGHILSQVGLMISYTFEDVPLEYTALADAIPYSLLGGVYCFITGSYSYMASNTGESTRSIAVGRVISSFLLAVVVGRAAGGVIVRHYGYYGVYCLSTTLFLMCLMYLYYFVPPEITKCEKEKSLPLCEYLSEGLSVISSIDPDRMKKIVALILVGLLHNTAFEGESSVIYIYTRRKFTWNEIDFSVYNTTTFTAQLVGTYISIVIFMRSLELGDISIGIIGLFSKTLFGLISAFAGNTALFYTGALFSIFSPNLTISVRSLLLKTADSGEMGRVNACFGMFESIAPLLGGTMYNFLYSRTLDKFPGAFFLITASIHVILLVPFFSVLKNEKLIDEMRKKIVD